MGKGVPAKTARKEASNGRSLLPHSGEVTANGAKRRDPFSTAERARNLLLDLDHTQVALRQVAGERDGQVLHKPQYLLGSMQERIQQVQRGLLLFAPTLPGRGRRLPRVGGVATTALNGAAALAPVGRKGRRSIQGYFPTAPESGTAYNNATVHAFNQIRRANAANFRRRG